MEKFMILKINNSKNASIKSGKWKDPGAKLYDQLMNACYYEGGVPEDADELDELIKKDGYKTWDSFLKEAYLKAPINKIVNKGPYGATSYSQSGCKYPHHVIRNRELVVHEGGLKAAYSRAKQMGIFSGEVKEHLERHYKELDLYEGSTMAMDEKMDMNFDFIESYIYESTGIDLYSPTNLFEEKSHGKLKSSFRKGLNIENGHIIKIVFELNSIQINPDKITDPEERKSLLNHVQTKGHNNFLGKGTVKAIIDEDSNKRLSSVKLIGLWSNNIFAIPEKIKRRDYNQNQLSTYPLKIREEIVNNQKANIKNSNDIMMIKVGEKIDKASFMATSNIKSLNAFADLIDYGNNIRQRGISIKKYLKNKDILEESNDLYQEVRNCMNDIDQFIFEKYQGDNSMDDIRPLDRNAVVDSYFVTWLFQTDEFYDDDPKTFDFDILINNSNIGNYVYGYYTDKLDGIIRIRYRKDEDYYAISMLFVNEKSQGSGIGQALLKFAIDKFGHNELRLNVFTFNERAIHIYKKYGFKIVKTIECKDEAGESSRFVGKEMYEMVRIPKEYDSYNNIRPLERKDVTNSYLTKWLFSDKELSDINTNEIDINGLIYDDSGNFAYGYFINGKPEGMIRVTHTKGDKFYGISMFYVNKPFRGHGIGKTLFDFIIDEYGNNDLILNISLDNENLNTVINFYKKYGFKITYKNETPENGSGYVVMTRKAKDSKEGLKMENVDSDDLSWIESYLTEEGEPPSLEEGNEKPSVPEKKEQPEPEEKKESLPKKTDKAESSKNGVRRKKLYIAFIEWAKGINPKNTFGSIFDKDAFHSTYPFVAEEMRYFYRLANPMLCVLTGDLTFFAVAELKKLNIKNSRLSEMMIFAATKDDVRVFNKKDKKVYRGTEENGMLKLAEVLGETFDTYIQKMINQGNILTSPLEESVDMFSSMTPTEGRMELWR